MKNISQNLLETLRKYGATNDADKTAMIASSKITVLVSLNALDTT